VILLSSLLFSLIIAHRQLGDVKKSDIRGPEALSQPGKKDGQVIMVRNGSLVEAHQVSGNIIILLVLTLGLVG
jgi:hypothetical protein